MDSSLATFQISDEAVYFCGQSSVTRTSWIANNPGRRFQGCSFYGRPAACDYFSWVDPPPHPWYKAIINGLLRKANNKGNDEQKLRRMVKCYQIALGVFLLGIIINKMWL
ncbi:GRF-type domain-containing protein [Abeliophyllum distichum]|uniref:GRF-type domain-containing protein n=1 Tax=Abeliophyllum distichum TaxID=126358 RepID=A0ABD1PUV2_9LAMI